MTTMKMYLPVLVLVGASILWGLSWISLKSINNMGVDGIGLIFVTYGMLAVTFAPLLVKQFRIYKEHKSSMLLIALFGGGANLAFTYALINGDVIRVMVLFYLLPVWGVIGGRLFLKEEVDILRYLGVFFAICGAFLILGGFEIVNTPPSWIDLVALLSGLFFALNNLIFRAVQAVPVSSKIGSMFFGCFILAGVFLIVGIEQIPVEINEGTWIMLVGYAFGWLLLANIGSQWGITHMEAGRSSIIIILELITAVISATLIAGETMSSTEWIGGILILTAALIEAFRTKEDESPLTTIEQGK